MGSVSTFDGGVFVKDGTDLCIRCCDAEIVTTTYRDTEWNMVGYNMDGDIYWRFKMTPNHPLHARIINGHLIMGLAYGHGRKYSLEGNLMLALPFDRSHDCIRDSSGNFYTCGSVYGSKNVRKYNSAGVLQWSIYTTATCYHIALNFDETMIVVGGNMVADGPPWDCVWVLNTSNGSEVISLPIIYSYRWVRRLAWDAFDNFYVLCDHNTGSSPTTALCKYDIAGNKIWHWFTMNGWSMAVGIDNVYVGSKALGTEDSVACLSKGEYPASAEEPIERWSIAGRGCCVALDPTGRLFTFSSECNLREIDPSNGNILDTWTNPHDFTDPTDGWRYPDICAGQINIVPAWACNTLYEAGDIVTHNASGDDEIYQCILAHTSCGPEEWVPKVWTIGDRCYYPTQTGDNTWILENNNKTGGDASPPGGDIDWASDNDEPDGEPTPAPWEDYWEVKT